MGRQLFARLAPGELWSDVSNFARQVEGKPWRATSVTPPRGAFFSKKTKVVFPVVLNCFGSDINKTRKGHSDITEIGMSRWEIIVI